MDAAGCLFLFVRDVSFFRHSGPEPESSRRASARREESFQPKDLGWLDAGSSPA